VRLLDAYCGAGGAAMGYRRAGFEVVGVDITPQPRYPFEFHLGDAIEFIREHGREFDVIHASPPCQAYSRATAWRGSRDSHPDLIAPTRRALLAAGRLYVIENVQEARALLHAPIMLCGTMFGLPIRRHRYFEVPALGLVLTPTCQHAPGDYAHDHGGKQTEAQYRDAMGCQWMTVLEAREAIPPAYTEWLGRRIVHAVQGVLFGSTHTKGG